MKKAWLILIILLLLGGYYILKPSKTHTEGVSYSLSGDEKRLFRSGDIIMRRGEGMVSDGIANMLQEPYDVTHCGVILEEKGKLWVVHSLQDKDRGVDGIFVQSIETLIVLRLFQGLGGSAGMVGSSAAQGSCGRLGNSKLRSNTASPHWPLWCRSHA